VTVDPTGKKKVVDTGFSHFQGKAYRRVRGRYTVEDITNDKGWLCHQTYNSCLFKLRKCGIPSSWSHVTLIAA
jgi:hypothetical protein